MYLLVFPILNFSISLFFGLWVSLYLFLWYHWIKRQSMSLSWALITKLPENLPIYVIDSDTYCVWVRIIAVCSVLLKLWVVLFICLIFVCNFLHTIFCILYSLHVSTLYVDWLKLLFVPSKLNDPYVFCTVFVVSVCSVLIIC